MCDKLDSLKALINNFVEERDWYQFHTPKNLTMALSVEVAELMEHFLWVDTAGSKEILESKRAEIGQELADVFIFVMRMSAVCDIELSEVVKQKIEMNRRKYPADIVKGSSKKYTEY